MEFKTIQIFDLLKHTANFNQERSQKTNDPGNITAANDWITNKHVPQG